MLRPIRSNLLLLALVSVGASVGCWEPAKAPGDGTASPTTQTIALRLYNCTRRPCQIAEESSRVFTLDSKAPLDQKDADKNLGLIPTDTAIEIVNTGLDVVQVTKAGQLFDLYRKKVLEKACYPFVFTQLNDLLYLGPPEQGLPDQLDLAKMLPAAQGKVCVDTAGRLVGIAVVQGKLADITNYLARQLGAPHPALALGSGVVKKWEAEVGARPDFDINLKAYTAFDETLSANQWRDMQHRKADLHIKESASKLSDKDLIAFYEISAIKADLKLHRGLEASLIERLEAKGVHFANQIGVISEDGIKELITDFKELYPHLKEIDISVIDTTKLTESVANIKEGRSALIINAPGEGHRALVYIHNVEGKKYVLVADAVGTNGVASAQALLDLSKTLKDKGYVFVTDVVRQRDKYNCAIFCLKDLATLERYPELLDRIKSDAEKIGSIGSATVLPAELLVTMQSLSMLQQNHYMGLFFEQAMAKKVPLELAKKRFEEVFVKPSEDRYQQASGKAKEVAQYELSFINGYAERFDEFYKSAELRQVYFYRAAAAGETPAPLGQTIRDKGVAFGTQVINAEITKLRTILISRAYLRAQSK